MLAVVRQPFTAAAVDMLRKGPLYSTTCATVLKNSWIFDKDSGCERRGPGNLPVTPGPLADRSYHDFHSNVGKESKSAGGFRRHVTNLGALVDIPSDRRLGRAAGGGLVEADKARFPAFKFTSVVSGSRHDETARPGRTREIWWMVT
jgi:hypothetical protein